MMYSLFVKGNGDNYEFKNKMKLKIIEKNYISVVAGCSPGQCTTAPIAPPYTNPITPTPPYANGVSMTFTCINCYQGSPVTTCTNGVWSTPISQCVGE